MNAGMMVRCLAWLMGSFFFVQRKKLRRKESYRLFASVFLEYAHEQGDRCFLCSHICVCVFFY